MGASILVELKDGRTLEANPLDWCLTHNCEFGEEDCRMGWSEECDTEQQYRIALKDRPRPDLEGGV